MTRDEFRKRRQLDEMARRSIARLTFWHKGLSYRLPDDLKSRMIHAGVLVGMTDYLFPDKKTLELFYAELKAWRDREAKATTRRASIAGLRAKRESSAAADLSASWKAAGL